MDYEEEMLKEKQMKSSKLKAGALLLASALIMQGCGDAPVTLTEQEEAVIVNYSAHVVAKYNRRQPDGLCYVSPEKLQEEEQEAETETETEQAADDTQSGSGQTSGGDHSSDVAAETKSMAEALGLSGVSVTYNGSEYKDSYIQPGTYALDAASGKKFLVLDFTVANTGDTDVDVDVLSKQPVIRLQMNDTRIAAKTTILLNDLSTYKDTIPAGGRSDVVLLFEVPEDSGETGQMQLEVQADGSNAVVNL